jgi:DNA-directed RNA polymerase subunit RPC12/RpoP
MEAELKRMDISFRCEKCGQHIVIDEAGEGMTVQCPSCNHNLTVLSKGEAVRKPAITVNLQGVI